MSKDMNVTLWPIWQSGVDDTEYADIGKQWPANVGYYMYAKRLTDTEMAAEYWHSAAGSRIRAYQRDSKGNILDERGVGWEYEREVMLRFATREHASENGYM